MIELKISPTEPGIITQTFKKINDMVRSGSIEFDTPVHLVLTAGVYREILSWNMANPLYMEASAGLKPEEVVIAAENCEAFHKDTENRAVFVIGQGATKVTLKGFTIENTHVKSADDAALGNQAEALCFHNQNGFLYCQNMRFISRQDTIHVKGNSRFERCYVTGDVDYIWGYCKTSVFEQCHIHTREDNRGGPRDAYVLQSRALNGMPGFIFIDCEFTADKRPEGGSIYIGRSQGTGRADSVDRWDSIALLCCTMDENYAPCLWTDEGGTREVWPTKGSQSTGWRQYNLKVKKEDGSLIKYDSSLEEKHGYELTRAEGEQLYGEYSELAGSNL